MSTTTQRKIDGQGRSVKELLFSRKYSIDYYQREYKWQTKQVKELIDDLVETFEEHHKPGNERRAVKGYGHYFLGSVIISDKDGQKFIIDGQQRLTTLTLLLIYLRHQLQTGDQRSQLDTLIQSQQYGDRSFNLDVPERAACMEALFEGKAFSEADPPESVANIRARYEDLVEAFPTPPVAEPGNGQPSGAQEAELRGGSLSRSREALPYFVDWLIENVHLVEITAYSDEDAYKIFEAMNDRGLSLTPKDMLKGYVLANIGSAPERTRASKAWSKRAFALQKLGREEDADAIKAWLRARHARTIRERKRDAEPGDFDLIGTQFHRWVRDQERLLGLQTSADFLRFVEQDFEFYTHWYEKLRRAADSLQTGLECVFFNAQHNFTLQFPVLLAPLCVSDAEATLLKKVRIVSAFLDILLYRRIWNWRAIDYSTLQYTMFRIMLSIRGLESEALAKLLREELDSDPATFKSNERFRLHGTNGRQIHRLLARMTDYVETRSGRASQYATYIQRGRKGYEVEHIWANHFERHTDEFPNPGEFQEYRNRIGGLLLLPKSFNASYGDMRYGRKLPHYYGQNLLARSLNPQAYANDPGFDHFVRESGLPFRAHLEFKKADLDARQALYQELAEQIWSPDRLEAEARAQGAGDRRLS